MPYVTKLTAARARLQRIPRVAGGSKCRLREEGLDAFLDFERTTVADVSLADEHRPNLTTLVDQIESRPVLITQGLPVRKIVVDHHRMMQLELCDLFDNVCANALMWKLRTVYPDDGQSFGSEAMFDRPEPRERPITVPAAKCPDVNEHDVAFEVDHANWFGVDPIRLIHMGELGQFPQRLSCISAGRNVARNRYKQSNCRASASKCVLLSLHQLHINKGASLSTAMAAC